MPFAKALAAKARRDPGQDSARRYRLGDASATRSSRSSKRADASSPGTTRSAGTPRPLQQPHPPEVARSSTDGSAFTGGAGIADQWVGNAQDRGPLARHADPARRAGASMPLQNGFAQNWLKTTGELLQRSAVLSGASTARAAVRADHPELARGRRVVCPDAYYLSIACAHDVHPHREPVFRPRSGRHRHADRGQAARRGCEDHGVGRRATTTGWRGRTASGCSGACWKPVWRFTNTTGRCSTTRRWWWTAWGPIGTTNFDNRSFAHNEENNICIYDAAVAEEFRRIF